MYVTLDVVFHEDTMYFSYESNLQGEYKEEVQTLDYGVHASEIGEVLKPMNQDESVLDTSGVNLDQSSDERSHNPMKKILECFGNK
jgi:hypothetical protein